MNINQVRRYALSLAEVTEAPHHHFSSFRVSGKIFVTVPPDELYIHVFVADEQRDIALSQAPEYVEKLYWGEKAVGVRIALTQAKPLLVNRLISQAWANKAPKTLVARKLN